MAADFLLLFGLNGDQMTNHVGRLILTTRERAGLSREAAAERIGYKNLAKGGRLVA